MEGFHSFQARVIDWINIQLKTFFSFFCLWQRQIVSRYHIWKICKTGGFCRLSFLCKLSAKVFNSCINGMREFTQEPKPEKSVPFTHFPHLKSIQYFYTILWLKCIVISWSQHSPCLSCWTLYNPYYFFFYHLHIEYNLQIAFLQLPKCFTIGEQVRHHYKKKIIKQFQCHKICNEIDW